MSDGRGCGGVDLLPCVEWREEDRDSAPVRTDSLRVAGRVSGRGHQLAVPRERLQEGSFSSVLHRLPANLTLAPGAKTSCRERCSWQQAFGKGDCMLSQEYPVLLLCLPSREVKILIMFVDLFAKCRCKGTSTGKLRHVVISREPLGRAEGAVVQPQ